MQKTLFGTDADFELMRDPDWLPSVKTDIYPMLDGKKKELVRMVGDGSIITRFDKTPFPKNDTDVVCPHFLELKWAYGCPFDCAWCFLKGTLRFQKNKTKPVVKDYEKIEKHILSFFKNNGHAKEVLNSGELADSLMAENNDKSLCNCIAPLFEKQNEHKLLILTKSTNIKNLLKIKNNGQVIVSFSLNAEEVSRRWERAPPTKERIKAAKKLYDRDFEVRIRIDPMVPIENWEKHYTALIDLIFKNFRPERITLGSLRGLQSTINNCKDRSWTKYLSESSNWGKKIDFDTRYLMYKTLIKYLKKNYNFNKVALCKETIEMWDKLEMDYRKIKCNCIL